MCLQEEGHPLQWTQSTTEVDIFVAIDDDTKSSDIQFEVHPQRLRLAARDKQILAGSLPERVNIDGRYSGPQRDLAWM